MAQFEHRELGGRGQWMLGGMVMVGDMFNHALKTAVDGLCTELSRLLTPDLVQAQSARSQMHSQGVQRQQQGGWSQTDSSRTPASTSLFVPGVTGSEEEWWPADLGVPAASGAQNTMRYAYFPEKRRLAVSVPGKVTVYDTLDHQVSGVSQQQGVGSSFTFTSQHGVVALHTLPVIASDRPAAGISGSTSRASASPPVSDAVSAQATDIFAALGASSRVETKRHTLRGGIHDKKGGVITQNMSVRHSDATAGCRRALACSVLMGDGKEQRKNSVRLRSWRGAVPTLIMRREEWTSLHVKGMSTMAERPSRQRSTRSSRVTLLGDDDLHYFNEGTHYQLYEKLGAHLVTAGRTKGTYFAVWAPNAVYVSVIGDFNDWNPESHALQVRGRSGIWEGFVADVGEGAIYKYHIVSRYHDYRVAKADPYGFAHEVPPRTASIVTDLWYLWGDQTWMEERARRHILEAPMAIYEMHLGSWMRVPEEGNRPLTYRELAPKLAAYIQSMGFTHVEFLPIMEHPLYASWGYQVTGYFAPTRRYGTPTDFMYLIDYLHQQGIGVILDWVPSHFPTDEHGPGYFDGTHLYEHADERQGMHPDWHSGIF